MWLKEDRRVHGALLQQEQQLKGRNVQDGRASLLPQEEIDEKLNNESIKVVSRGFHALKTAPPPRV